MNLAHARSKAAAFAFLVACTFPVALAHADEDEEAKPHELKLLAKALEGQEERLVYDVSRQVAGAGGRSDSIDLTILRKIEAVDDGLASREQLTIEKLLYNGEETKLPITSVPVIRPNKSRQATIAPGGPQVQQEDPDDADGADGEGIAMLRRDPDGLARALAPKGAKKKGDEWTLDVGSLLLLFGPAKAKVVAEGSSARAKLEVWTKADATATVEISIEAKIRYTRGDDEKTIHSLKLTGTLKGPADGSAPPSKEQLTLVAGTEGGDSTRTVIASLERTLVSPGKEPEAPGEPEKKPGEKKKDKDEGPF